MNGVYFLSREEFHSIIIGIIIMFMFMIMFIFIIIIITITIISINIDYCWYYQVTMARQIANVPKKRCRRESASTQRRGRKTRSNTKKTTFSFSSNACCWSGRISSLRGTCAHMAASMCITLSRGFHMRACKSFAAIRPRSSGLVHTYSSNSR